MTDIPEDIREAAIKAADEHDDRMRKTYLAGAPDRHAAMVEIVAQALLSERMKERERCAQIADDVGREPCSCGGSCYKPGECEVFDAWFYEGCEAVARVIRSGE